jgi:hypothetical protein
MKTTSITTNTREFLFSKIKTNKNPLGKEKEERGWVSGWSVRRPRNVAHGKRRVLTQQSAFSSFYNFYD